MSKKALNFDLNDSLLRKNYPSNNYKKAWYDIRYFLENSGFKHRQYSGYISKSDLSMSKTIQIIKKMSKKYNWLSLSVQEFDVTLIGDEFSLKKYIQQKNNFSLVKNRTSMIIMTFCFQLLSFYYNH